MYFRGIQLNTLISKFVVLSVHITFFNSLHTKPITTDKRGYPHNIFLISPQKHIWGYSFEAPQWGASNEYQQRMFSWRNKKDISIFRMKKSALSVAMKTCWAYTLSTLPFIVRNHKQYTKNTIISQENWRTFKIIFQILTIKNSLCIYMFCLWIKCQSTI